MYETLPTALDTEIAYRRERLIEAASGTRTRTRRPRRHRSTPSGTRRHAHRA